MAAQPLYPTPKTPEERRADDSDRRRRQAKQLPKLNWLVIPVFGSVALWCVLQFIRSIPDLWNTEDMGPIFFSFSLWLGIAGIAIWWAFDTNRRLYAHGKPRATFWVSYVIIAICTIALHVTQLLPPLFGVDGVTLIVLSHCALLFLITIPLFGFGNTREVQ